jgi:hypothetical protein
MPDRMVFDKLIQVLVFGCGYRRFADHTCSATTLRRRRDEWIALGLAEQLRLAVLAAYDRMLGLSLDHLAVDGCTTKAPCGGQSAGPSPVDRREQGSTLGRRRGGWHPAGRGARPGQPRDDRLLAATLDAITTAVPLPERLTVHLGAGYDYQGLPGRAGRGDTGRPPAIAYGAAPDELTYGRR